MGRFILLFVVFFVCSASVFSQSGRFKIKRNQIFYVPEEVEETSGLVFFNGELLTHNDSGGKSMLYALDTMGGEIKRRIYIKGAINRDWEAITTSKNRLYIGDFGNNSARRKDLTIYITDFPSDKDTLSVTDSIRFHYPQQTNFEKQKHDHDFDCEAMVVYKDSVYLYSKGWKNGTTYIRAVPAIPGEYAANEIGKFTAGGLITDAAFDGENNILAFCGYNIETAIMQPFVWIFNTNHPGKIKLSNGVKIMLEPVYSQMEGATFISSRRLFITAEGLNNKWIDIAPALFKINLDALMLKVDGN